MKFIISFTLFFLVLFQNVQIGFAKQTDVRGITFALNTSTISGYGLSLPEMINLTAEAGFKGIELWIQDVEKSIEEGGTIGQLAALITNSGLSVENMIGFAPCLSENESVRMGGIKQFRSELEMAKSLGSKCIAVTGAGLEETFDWSKLDMYAKQYGEILDICKGTGVQPVLELWGSHHLNRVEYVAAILLRTGKSDGALLLDLYHLYRGGNFLESFMVIDPSLMPVIHINDYPGNIPYDELNDADRVMPGEGICPFDDFLAVLHQKKYKGVLSVELFNKNYWEAYKPDALLKKIMNELENLGL